MKIWKVPAVLAGITAVGLISALLADGWADVLSWLALGIPLAIVWWCISAPRDKRPA